jgi:hypothetical protein
MGRVESKRIEFCKMSGSGNDFIIIDNRELSLNVGDIREFVQKVCRHKLSVGADGLFLIEPSAHADFKWQFFNSDGSQAEMCGNGGRCAARFAVLKGIGESKLSFETIAGVIHAEVSGAVVKIQLPRPKNLELNIRLDVDGAPLVLQSINTGVPHVVLFSDDLESIDSGDTKDIPQTINLEDGEEKFDRICELATRYGAEAYELAREVDRNPPLSVRASVRTRRWYLKRLTEEADMQQSPLRLYLTEDFQEAARARSERREPRPFQGR